MELRTRSALSADEENERAEPLDPRVLSSVLVSVKMAQFQEESSHRDPQERLLELMHSPAVRALLDAAQAYGQRRGVTALEGLQEIVTNFQQIDQLWNQVLMKEGLARLSSQYH